MSNQEQENLAKLRWHCRRGMLELDALLLPFFEHKYVHLSQQQQQAFVILLAEEDTFLFSWLMGHAQPDDKSLIEIIALIREYAKTRD